MKMVETRTRLPLIGITTHGLNKDGSFHSPQKYTTSIRKAGGIPFLLPPGESELETLADTLDGFVFSGGGDLDPSLYNGLSHASIYGVDKERDRTELALAEIILRDEIPTLAICRGLQVFTVALGGTLKADILEGQSSVEHRMPFFKTAFHSVSLEKGSRLLKIIGKERIMCASIHHQAVNSLPPNAVATAHGDDGIIESFEIKQRDHLLAVQWHPEITADKDQRQLILFKTLVEMARKTKTKGGSNAVK